MFNSINIVIGNYYQTYLKSQNVAFCLISLNHLFMKYNFITFF